jgi:hypothetical protein
MSVCIYKHTHTRIHVHMYVCMYVLNRDQTNLHKFILQCVLKTWWLLSCLKYPI